MKAKQKTASDTSAQQDAIALLKADHRKVTGLFGKYQAAQADQEKSALARQICNELIVHTILEEEIFYPACRAAGVQDSTMDEAQVEHDGAKVLIAGLLRQQAGSPFYDARVSVLAEYIRHHIKEEERGGSGIFAKAKAAKVDMDALGLRLQQRKQELMAQAQAGEVTPSAPRSLEFDPTNRHRQEQQTMPRQYERDRDEQGRFMSEDEERSNRGNESRYAARGSEGRGSGWYGDSQGHARASEEGWENRSRSRSSSSGRYSDEDDYRGSSAASRDSSGRSQGGWFGDPEGHSRASEEGWENRGRPRSSSSGRYEYEDDNRYSASRGGSQGRGQGGWSGDPEGHSRASQEGWENRGRSRSSSSGRYADEDERSSRGGSQGRGHGGWFGDPEGHSRASEEGWENRGRSRSGASGRYADEDERSARGGSEGRGHGGWFGDPRGHSEASRRGWQDR